MVRPTEKELELADRIVGAWALSEHVVQLAAQKIADYRADLANDPAFVLEAAQALWEKAGGHSPTAGSSWHEAYLALRAARRLP